MKTRLLLALLLSVWIGSGAWAQSVQYTTEQPRVDEANDPDVIIQRVELTSQYTIIYMRYRSSKKSMFPRNTPRRLPFPLPKDLEGYEQANSNTITFVASARLYVNQGEKAFKFIRAENIPVERQPNDRRRDVEAGERVDFVAYFERITPGYEVFDLFECSDRNRPGQTCFNFWGVHITNPAKQNRTPPARVPDVQTRRTPPPATPTKPAPAPKVEPTPEPEPMPAPAPSVSMKGTVRDAKTKKPLVATVTYQLLSGAESDGNNSADSVLSGRLAGNYQIAAEPLSVYAVTAKAKGYFSQSDTLTVTKADKLRDFDLVPIEAGTKVTLKNIYFNVSKFDLKPESFPELDRLVQLMRENPGMSIRLEGHTDTVGDFDANVELSRNRVNEVKAYLVRKGIAAARIETIGYGPSRPINTNRGLKERPENRRVELVITKS
ncbi:OmpA family protein [Rudanella paleaurantiibacter]|uniref:OmpA family protein n=2 Tax=Rudanella paleaurantiibacter TaxID=2614655 RepID=A0A7J5U169_9BACT|nr:OmpA family protein [Rudanella paleaurantiibacter]KAB7731419.1 OmpA family protein [Rudanella paleaurantiibacter]